MKVSDLLAKFKEMSKVKQLAVVLALVVGGTEVSHMVLDTMSVLDLVVSNVLADEWTYNPQNDR